MSINSKRFPKWNKKAVKLTILIGVILLVFVSGSLFMYTLTRPRNILPASVNHQLTFSPFVATTSDKQTVSHYRVAKVENGTQTLTYHINTHNGDVTVTQYLQPPQFTDIPNYKDQFLSNVINQYATVQTSNGVIYLGRADKQNNHQIGVMLEKGLLVFFNPTNELSEQTWRSIGNSLTIENTGN